MPVTAPRAQGIDSVHRLDQRFGKANKTVISQRDVPGVTRAIVPLMVERGVLAFSEGCNAQIQPPSTPSSIFNWSDPASGQSVLMMLHPRGYGLEEQDDATGLPAMPRVSRALFPSWNRSILTEIYLCHACSYHHEIEDGNAWTDHAAGRWGGRPLSDITRRGGGARLFGGAAVRLQG
jgi:hypothetical protein|eukprot:COSAG01_NODE_185_length_22691_cov_53.142478_23_plen_178_part_00